MRVFVVGASGRVGTRVAGLLVRRGDTVSGLVRTEAQRRDLAERGVDAVVGELGKWSLDEAAGVLAGAEAVVFAAGSNATSAEVTARIDVAGLATVAAAVQRLGTGRLLVVSVMPESWRERNLTDVEEHYFAAKKRAEAALVRTSIEWLVLRPALLVDEVGVGRVSLGPAEVHEQVTLDDTAAVVAALVHEPRLGRRILELNRGATPIDEAVRALVEG